MLCVACGLNCIYVVVASDIVNSSAGLVVPIPTLPAAVRTILELPAFTKSNFPPPVPAPSAVDCNANSVPPVASASSISLAPAE